MSFFENCFTDTQQYIKAVQLYEITIEHLTGKQIQEK